jgi:hypothetical protein
MKFHTIDQFHDDLKAQGLPRDDMAVVCPMCGTVQSPKDLIAAGAGATFEDVEPYIGFSCVGRWTCAPSPRKEPDGQPCNWTLGGLLQLHKLEVVGPDGRHHPHFEPATPEQAQKHAAAKATETTPS